MKKIIQTHIVMTLLAMFLVGTVMTLAYMDYQTQKKIEAIQLKTKNGLDVEKQKQIDIIRQFVSVVPTT